MISWKTKKQPTVSRSSAEAEYRSLGNTCYEIKWISYLLQDMGIVVLLPISVNCHSQAAIAVAKNPILHEKMKHVELDLHFVRDLVT